MKRIAAVVAAAGCGRRYGSARKLQANLNGRPVLAWTLEMLAALPLVARIVVVAPGDDDAATLTRRSGARVVVNHDPGQGLGVSIACGVRALDEEPGGVLVALGDMPLVRRASVLALLECGEGLDASAVVAPVHGGRRGHPVLFGAAHLAVLRQLRGDRGARVVLEAAAVTPVEVDDPGVLLDIDTPADLAVASRAGAPGAPQRAG